MEDTTMYGLMVVAVVCYIYRDAIMKFLSSDSTKDAVKSAANTVASTASDVASSANTAANTTAKGSVNYIKNYQGCYLDLEKVPRFANKTENLMTLESCGKMALSKNAPYFALQNSNGLSVGTCHYGTVNKNKSNYNTIGVAKNCVNNWNGNVYGGHLSNAVYSTPGYVSEIDLETASAVPVAPAVTQGFVSYDGPHGGIEFGNVLPNY